MILAIPGGILLDAAQFQLPGSNIILLLISVFAVSLLQERWPPKKHPILATIFACALGTGVFVLAQLLFFAGTLSITQRIALLPHFFLLALPLNALGAGPFLFASLGILERIFSKQPDPLSERHA